MAPKYGLKPIGTLGGWLLVVWMLCTGAANQQAETRALVVLPNQPLRTQTRVDAALHLGELLQTFAIPSAYARKVKTYTLRYQDDGDHWFPVLSVESRLALPVGVMRGAKIEQQAGTFLHAMQPRVPASQRKLFTELASQADSGSCLQLYYFAPETGGSFAQFVKDLDQIWNAGLSEGINEYENALGMLGELVAVRADAWQTDGRVTGRMIFAMKEAGMVKRFGFAMALAKNMGKVATSAAVRSGSMSKAEGQVLEECLSTLKISSHGLWVQGEFSFNPEPLLPQTAKTGEKAKAEKNE